MGWSADTCILSFRGTSSFTNVLADLQVATPVLPPVHSSVMVCRSGGWLPLSQ